MNWGAFAGGLAQGIEKQQELALKKKQLEEEANNQIIKRQAETEKMLAESEKQKTDFMTKYTDKVLEYETKIADAKDADEMNSQINALNNYKKISRTMAEKLFQADGQNQDNIVNSLNFDFLPKVTNYTIKDVSGNNTTVTLPEGLQAEQLRLMENGNIGQVVVNQQGKEAGVNATTITPIKFKQDKIDGELAIIDGKAGYYSKEQLFKATEQGMSVEKPKTSTSTSTTTVLGESKPIEIANEFGEFYANKDTGEPIRNNKGEIVYKKMNDKTMKVVEGIDQARMSISTLNNMVKILDKNPEAIGSFGENPYQYVWNKVNDVLGVPTPELVDRNSLLGESGAMAAMLRNAVETGVMTEKDREVYIKFIPSPDDAEDVFKNKAKTLVKGLNSRLKSTEERYGEVIKIPKTSPQNFIESVKKTDFNTAFKKLRESEKTKDMTDEDIERYLKSKGINR